MRLFILSTISILHDNLDLHVSTLAYIDICLDLRVYRTTCVHDYVCIGLRLYRTTCVQDDQTTSYNHLLLLHLISRKGKLKQQQARNPPLAGGLRSQKGLRPFNPLHNRVQDDVCTGLRLYRTTFVQDYVCTGLRLYRTTCVQDDVCTGLRVFRTTCTGLRLLGILEHVYKHIIILMSLIKYILRINSYTCPLSTNWQ